MDNKEDVHDSEEEGEVDPRVKVSQLQTRLILQTWIKL